MAADSRNCTSEMLISRRPKKNRNRVNATGNRDLIIGNGTPVFIKQPKMEPIVVMATRKVPVLYYLTRNGHLEHPHLIDVTLSSPHGLYLRDVMNTLNYQRGKGMANMYSWSFKRSYKNGYVWHDLAEDDLIEATNGHDYVLKGSELLQTQASQNPTETSEDCSSATTMMRRRNQSWSSFDNPQEYMVVKCESSRELAVKFAADAATQTEEERRVGESLERERKEYVTMRLGVGEEIPSPPPSNSSSEVLEGVNVDDQRVKVRDRDGDLRAEVGGGGGGRMKASEIVKQLITCGAPSRIKMEAGRKAIKDDAW